MSLNVPTLGKCTEVRGGQDLPHSFKLGFTLYLLNTAAMPAMCQGLRIHGGAGKAPEFQGLTVLPGTDM